MRPSPCPRPRGAPPRIRPCKAPLRIRPLGSLPRIRPWVATMLLCAAGALSAQPLDCTLDGVSVHPDNGSTTAGRSGLMRCVDRQSRTLLREIEYRNGRTIGLQRWYENGVLRREYSVDDRGNRDGRTREWNAQGVLVREANQRGGASVGLQRTWYDDGRPRTVGWWGDGTAPRNEAESLRGFDPLGRLAELRCPDAPRLDDDAALCGFEGAPATVPLWLPWRWRSTSTQAGMPVP
jgi:hypothetical protein